MTAWEHMGEALLLKLLNSMVARTATVIAVDGWYTKYESGIQFEL